MSPLDSDLNTWHIALSRSLCVILDTMRRICFFLVLLLGCTVVAGQSVYLLSAAEWAGPRSGERILQMDGIRPAVQEVLSSSSNRLRLKYPGGDEGRLWVEELRSWLWALGLAPERIELRPGSLTKDLIELEVLYGN